MFAWTWNDSSKRGEIYPGQCRIEGPARIVTPALGDTMHLEFAGLGAMDVPIRAHE